MTDWPDGGADDFPDQPTLHASTLATGGSGHSTWGAKLGNRVTTLQLWTRPALNAKAWGCKGDDIANDSATAIFINQLAASGGYDVYYRKGIYRCDDGTNATRVVTSYAAAKGNTRIKGDGPGNTVFKSHVPLDVAGKALVDSTDTNSTIAPIYDGFSSQGPGSFVNPNDVAKTATTSGTGNQITSLAGANNFVGCVVAGDGIPADTYIKKASGTTATLSRNLDGSGGVGTDITIGTAHPKVGNGVRVASACYLIGGSCRGWYGGLLTTSEGNKSIAVDHPTVTSWNCQENAIGHWMEDTSGGTLDFKWIDFRCSRNAICGVGVGPTAFIGSAHMTDCHFNAQPWAIAKIGTAYGDEPAQLLFIDGLVLTRTKFEGSANFSFFDTSGMATIRGLFEYGEPHGVEINGQKNKNLWTPYAANDHTRRDVKIASMSRSGSGTVTATTDVAMDTDHVGDLIAVCSEEAGITNGTGTVTETSHTVSGAVGFTSADVGKIIIGPGIPANTIIGAYSAGNITLHDFTGANVNAGSAGTGPGPWAGIALCAGANHGDYKIATIVGNVVTWETGIQASFGPEGGALGLIGTMFCGSFLSSDFYFDYQNDPSTSNYYPERYFSILEGQDVVFRPTQADKAPINFPKVRVRGAVLTPAQQNVVCKQGGITAWLGPCGALITRGYIVDIGAWPASGCALHDGLPATPVGGMALQDGDVDDWIWIQELDGGFIDADHGAALACASGVAAKVKLVVDAANPGKVKAWNGSTTRLVHVANSVKAESGGKIQAKSCPASLTV